MTTLPQAQLPAAQPPAVPVNIAALAAARISTADIQQRLSKLSGRQLQFIIQADALTAARQMMGEQVTLDWKAELGSVLSHALHTTLGQELLSLARELVGGNHQAITVDDLSHSRHLAERAGEITGALQVMRVRYRQESTHWYVEQPGHHVVMTGLAHALGEALDVRINWQLGTFCVPELSTRSRSRLQHLDDLGLLGRALGLKVRRGDTPAWEDVHEALSPFVAGAPGKCARRIQTLRVLGAKPPKVGDLADLVARRVLGEHIWHLDDRHLQKFLDALSDSIEAELTELRRARTRELARLRRQAASPVN